MFQISFQFLGQCFKKVEDPNQLFWIVGLQVTPLWDIDEEIYNSTKFLIDWLCRIVDASRWFVTDQ